MHFYRFRFRIHFSRLLLSYSFFVCFDIIPSAIVRLLANINCTYRKEWIFLLVEKVDVKPKNRKVLGGEWGRNDSRFEVVIGDTAIGTNKNWIYFLWFYFKIVWFSWRSTYVHCSIASSSVSISFLGKKKVGDYIASLKGQSIYNMRQQTIETIDSEVSIAFIYHFISILL